MFGGRRGGVFYTKNLNQDKNVDISFGFPLALANQDIVARPLFYWLDILPVIQTGGDILSRHAIWIYSVH